MSDKEIEMTKDERDELERKIIRAVAEFNESVERFVVNTRALIRRAKFAKALCDAPVTCNCSAVLFATYYSKERPGTLADVLETRTDLKGGWAR
jgi:hypothetical protein